MATPPKKRKYWIDDLESENDVSCKRQKPKRGGPKYQQLQKFIETRRKKKRDQRCTLDPSAKVIF